MFLLGLIVAISLAFGWLVAPFAGAVVGGDCRGVV
jgi:hypothetical protein